MNTQDLHNFANWRVEDKDQYSISIIKGFKRMRFADPTSAEEAV